MNRTQTRQDETVKDDFLNTKGGTNVNDGWKMRHIAPRSYKDRRDVSAAFAHGGNCTQRSLPSVTAATQVIVGFFTVGMQRNLKVGDPCLH